MGWHLLLVIGLKELGFNIDMELKDDGCHLNIKENVAEVRTALVRYFDVKEVWLWCWLEDVADLDNKRADMSSRLTCAGGPVAVIFGSMGLCQVGQPVLQQQAQPDAGDGPVQRSFMIEFHSKQHFAQRSDLLTLLKALAWLACMGFLFDGLVGRSMVSKDKKWIKLWQILICGGMS